ncbi:MAG: bifunctional phosphoglucose/phosphomannose isomerase [Ammonifex sp.]|nr:MAG: bifunctional phosphoglucose/phosphomannose isomerase [Ammonifex sp.]
MVDINDAAALKNLDTIGMHAALERLAAQCADAYNIGQKAPLPRVGEVRAVLVTGLGGSAIGGDLLRVYCQDRSGVPVAVNRDYNLPAFADDKTLIFAVSYSGNTEETLNAFRLAYAKGCRVAVLTSGGKLAALAAEKGVPVVPIPSGLAPRAATGYLFLPMLAALERLGLLNGIDGAVAELVEVLRAKTDSYRLEVPSEKNPAKQLALDFRGRIPVIWGASGTTEVVALRWKGQVNENAKSPAYCNNFPELNHNEIVGFEQPGELLNRLWVVLLKDKGDDPRVECRMEVTKRIIAGKVAGVTEVASAGESMLARLYSLIYLGDWASFYLAALYGIDPGPVRVIDYLKGELAKQQI